MHTNVLDDTLHERIKITTEPLTSHLFSPFSTLFDCTSHPFC